VPRNRFAKGAALACAALALSGCFKVGYILQAGEGQLDLVCRARPIERVLDDPDTPPDVKDELASVGRMKEFGKAYGLVPTSSYEDYVELDRPVAVWVVSAAPKLSLDPLTWSFPIVGSVPYLGWFDKDRAIEHAKSLAEEGWDVDLRGASAYSTLGFFDDPVLSSMLGDASDGYGDLADTILHESLHATVYVKGQTSFDEGLATFVGERLAEAYLVDRYGADSPEVRKYEEEKVQGRERQTRLIQAFKDLDALYRSRKSKAEKLAEKAQYLLALRSELHLRRPITNATLAGFRAYEGGSKQFEELFTACGGDMKKFIAAAKRVQPADFDAPQSKAFGRVVAKLVARGCPKPAAAG
jgi:predicted aminopeptidase